MSEVANNTCEKLQVFPETNSYIRRRLPWWFHQTPGATKNQHTAANTQPTTSFSTFHRKASPRLPALQQNEQTERSSSTPVGQHSNNHQSSKKSRCPAIATATLSHSNIRSKDVSPRRPTPCPQCHRDYDQSCWLPCSRSANLWMYVSASLGGSV